MNSFVVDLNKYNELKAQKKIGDELDSVLNELSFGRFVYARRILTNQNGKINRFYSPILKQIIKIDSLKKMRDEIKNELKKLKETKKENEVEYAQLKANNKAAKEIIREISR